MTSTPAGTVLVTGAATGIGAGIASRFAVEGFRVGVFDIDGDAAERTASALPNQLGVALEGSTTDPSAVTAAFDALGTPDVVVNNAGIVRFGPLADLELADWSSVVEVNLTGTFVVAQAAARRWMAEERGGPIVNLTSMNGVAPGPNAGAYGATKAAVALLTQQMALEWGPAGIRVNAVAPGLVDGGMSAPIYADAVTRAARTARVPLGRLGVVEDVAEAVWWLASAHSSYVTGQQLLVDGGVTMGVISGLPRPATVDGVGDTPGPGSP